jgi:hypothetical protein
LVLAFAGLFAAPCPTCARRELLLEEPPFEAVFLPLALFLTGAGAFLLALLFVDDFVFLSAIQEFLHSTPGARPGRCASMLVGIIA